MYDTINAARDLLTETTPLRHDCGEHCAAACCRDDGDEELGMLLFPGEDALYAPEDASWMRITPSSAMRLGRSVPLMLCSGSCPRAKRPFACRIFPLAPKARSGAIQVRMDARARFLCPLAESGVHGLDPAFVDAVGKAFALLWSDPTQRDYLMWLSRLIDEHAKMLKTFAGR